MLSLVTLSLIPQDTCTVVWQQKGLYMGKAASFVRHVELHLPEFITKCTSNFSKAHLTGDTSTRHSNET